MAPTRKGNYKDCFFCKFKKEEIKQYPCVFSHKYVRENTNGTGVKYEREFKFCGLKEV